MGRHPNSPLNPGNSSLDACADLGHRRWSVHDLAALRFEPTTLDLLTPLHADLVVLLEEPKPFAYHFARIVVEAALDLSVDELLELWRQ